MGFDIIVVVSLLIPLLALPWVWLTVPKGFIQPTWRSWLGFGSLSAVTLQTLAFITAFFVVAGIGGFDEKVQFGIAWMKINRISCLAIMLAALFGKGRLRLVAFFTAAALISFAAVVYEMK
jgi:hypothetical protein